MGMALTASIRATRRFAPAFAVFAVAVAFMTLSWFSAPTATQAQATGTEVWRASVTSGTIGIGNWGYCTRLSGSGEYPACNSQYGSISSRFFTFEGVSYQIERISTGEQTRGVYRTRFEIGTSSFGSLETATLYVRRTDTENWHKFLVGAGTRTRSRDGLEFRTFYFDERIFSASGQTRTLQIARDGPIPTPTPTPTPTPRANFTGLTASNIQIDSADIEVVWSNPRRLTLTISLDISTGGRTAQALSITRSSATTNHTFSVSGLESDTNYTATVAFTSTSSHTRRITFRTLKPPTPTPVPNPMRETPTPTPIPNGSPTPVAVRTLTPTPVPDPPNVGGFGSRVNRNSIRFSHINWWTLNTDDLIDSGFVSDSTPFLGVRVETIESSQEASYLPGPRSSPTRAALMRYDNDKDSWVVVARSDTEPVRLMDNDFSGSDQQWVVFSEAAFDTITLNFSDWPSLPTTARAVWEYSNGAAGADDWAEVTVSPDPFASGVERRGSLNIKLRIPHWDSFRPLFPDGPTIKGMNAIAEDDVDLVRPQYAIRVRIEGCPNSGLAGIGDCAEPRASAKVGWSQWGYLADDDSPYRLRIGAPHLAPVLRSVHDKGIRIEQTLPTTATYRIEIENLFLRHHRTEGYDYQLGRYNKATTQMEIDKTTWDQATHSFWDGALAIVPNEWAVLYDIRDHIPDDRQRGDIYTFGIADLTVSPPRVTHATRSLQGGRGYSVSILVEPTGTRRVSLTVNGVAVGNRQINFDQGDGATQPLYLLFNQQGVFTGHGTIRFVRQSDDVELYAAPVVDRAWNFGEMIFGGAAGAFVGKTGPYLLLLPDGDMGVFEQLNRAARPRTGTIDISLTPVTAVDQNTAGLFGNTYMTESLEGVGVVKVSTMWTMIAVGAAVVAIVLSAVYTKSILVAAVAGGFVLGAFVPFNVVDIWMLIIYGIISLAGVVITKITGVSL